MDHRLDLIGRIRWESARAAATRAAASTGAAHPPVAGPSATAVADCAPLPTAQESAGPRRSSVQVALLVVGISLLSIAAIFFLIYAFITFGLVARSLIVGGVTIASIATAALLRRGRLPNTAEGIAVFALVLIYLDAWALRTNDFFGLHSTPLAGYWGWVFVVTAVPVIAWARLSALRAPSIVAFTFLPVGFGLVVGSWADSADRIFVTFVAVSLAGVVHRLATRPAKVEHSISFVVTSIALAISVVSALWVSPQSPWGITVAFAVIATAAALNAAAVDVRAGEPAGGDSVGAARAGAVFSGAVFSAAAGATAAATFAVATLRNHDSTFDLIAPSVAAIVVALSIEATLSRARTESARLRLRVAASSAAIVAGITLLLPLAVLLSATAATLWLGLGEPWSLGGGSQIVTSHFYLPARFTVVASVIAVGVVIALIAVTWVIRRVARVRSLILAWALAIGLPLVAPGSQTLWIVLVVWLLLAVLAVVVLIRIPNAPRAPLAALAFGAAVLAYCTAWASQDTWAITSVVVIGVILLMRLVFTSTAAKASLLGVALTLAIIGAGATARDLALPLHPSVLADAINVARATGFVAILLLALTAVVSAKTITDLDRRVTFWVTVVTLATSVLVSQLSLHSLAPQSNAGLLLPEYGTGFVVSLFLLVSLSVWLVGGIARMFRAERAAIAALVAPAIAFVVDSLVQVLAVTSIPPQLVFVIAATIAAALSLALAAARPGAASRTAVDLGILLVAVPGVVGALYLSGPSTWLVLEVAAVCALLVACGRDGLFGSASPRKHVGWVALGLATAGLWWWLKSEQVTEVESWVLPVSGLLLLIAVLAWASRRPGRSPAARSASVGAAPWITFAALLVSIVPVSLTQSVQTQARPIAVGLFSAALLLGGVALVSPLTARPVARQQAEPFLRIMIAAGWIGVVLVSVVQAGALHVRLSHEGRWLDLWVAATVTVLAVSALLLVRSHQTSALPMVASEALYATALLVLVALELTSLTASDRGFARALLIVVALCLTHLVGLVLRRSPFTWRIGWGSTALAALVGTVALVSGAFDDVEWISVPLGLVLLATGATQLRWVRSSGSWPWLAPGVLILVVPSLLSTAWDPAPWRLVGLGFACVALIIAGVLLKVQSPFVIASVVALIHAISTFSPQITAVYQSVEWWVWLALGGVSIVVVSVRFEKSREGVKWIAHSIGGLR